MYNLDDDNELDRLSSEAAGKYEVPGEANWQKMRAELDKVLPVQKEKRRSTFFWWLLPVLLTGGAMYWGLEKNNEISVPAGKNTTVNNTINPGNTQTALSKENKVSLPRTDVAEGNVSAKAREEKTLLPVKTGLSARNMSSQKAGNDPFPANNHPMAKPAERRNEQASIRVAGKSKVISAKSNPVEHKQIDNTVAAPFPKTAAAITKDTPEKVNPDKPAATNIATDIQSNPPVAAQSVADPSTNSIAIKTNKQPIAKKTKGWSYALLAGIDKSTVKFKYGNEPGFNIGLLAGYHFNNRWSVHTGAIYTQKNYKVAGEDFTAPKGSWISYYKLENVDGYCRMWEVPILIRFAVSKSANHSFFISTGLSSYFMTKEDYNYFYYFNGQPITRNSSFTSKNTHILSIGHLAAGFENRLSRNLSLQIEPYAKIPLGDIGLGNIRLSSFGVNFYLQHGRQLSTR